MVGDQRDSRAGLTVPVPVPEYVQGRRLGRRTTGPLGWALIALAMLTLLVLAPLFGAG
ncbi:hypothetical protein OG413_35470 [Streptomyces sp. NBC_01433]|uniref:hypothetical protein n=1 Tax=Streptomyces sp. NBC_01433 TaxID=2903864 RepID=UPI00224D2EC7|nr:hypothetical protein [Streptomyces sp. NBC_01433]MCX4680519.1 hypothetical protein [Streptomyces sp. NBC_01433]